MIWYEDVRNQGWMFIWSIKDCDLLDVIQMLQAFQESFSSRDMSEETRMNHYSAIASSLVRALSVNLPQY